ncbi:unnamed protein product [Sympodiomycopsis kandeliae]
MDQLSLLKLLSDSTKQLASLHEELGHPPDRLQDAISTLHNVLKDSVQGQMDKVQKEVDDAKYELSHTRGKIQHLRIALGEQADTHEEADQQPQQQKQTTGHRRTLSRQASHSTPRHASSSSSSSSTSPPAGPSTEPLLPRLQSTMAEANRLQTLYNSRKSQSDKLTAQLDSFRPILGSFVPEISTQSIPATDPPTQIIPAQHLVQLSATIDKCGQELTRRSEQLQELLFDILGLWSELCLAPEQSDDDSPTPCLDTLILRHLDLKPLFEKTDADGTEQFLGNFQGLGRNEDATATGLDTPTRTPPAQRNSVGGVLRSERSADTHFPPHVLIPSPENIARASAKQEWLRAEKQRREDKIQELYDELLELWTKFGVSNEEMDEFVIDNSGSTLSVIESYESELSKMKELKKTHMVYFVSQVRESIDALWKQLRTSPEEKQDTFPEYFDQVEESMDPSEMDYLLSRHESQIQLLQEELNNKLPLLKLVEKYTTLLGEEQELEESAKDSTRLMKSVRGDPGRLLREEKMRKRIAVQKPKMEADLLKLIPVWESENDKVFTIDDGTRYYDKLVASSNNAANKKRVRTVSTVSTGTPLQQANTNRGAPTPLRSKTPGGTTTGSEIKRVKTQTPATGNLRARVPQSQIASSRGGPPPSASSAYSSRQVIPSSAQSSRTRQMSTTSRIPTTSSSVDNPFSQRLTSKTSSKPPTKPFVTPSSMRRISQEGYHANHNFRPRPSTTTSTTALPRNMSVTSVSSEATTITSHAGARNHRDEQAYRSAIPSKTKNKRGPSMSLANALQNGEFRSISIRPIQPSADIGMSASGSGSNWARLDEDFDQEQEITGHDQMEVF